MNNNKIPYIFSIIYDSLVQSNNKLQSSQWTTQTARLLYLDIVPIIIVRSYGNNQT